MVRGQLRSTIFLLFESPYMTSYLTSIDNFFLSRTVFEIFDFKVFRVRPWAMTYRGRLGSKIFPPFESSYMISYLTSIDTFSLFRAVFKIFHSKGFRVWPWSSTFRGQQGSKLFSQFESYTWLPIQLLLTFSLYLVPFLRYSTSKFSRFDPDLWRLEVTWGR